MLGACLVIAALIALEGFGGWSSASFQQAAHPTLQTVAGLPSLELDFFKPILI